MKIGQEDAGGSLTEGRNPAKAGLLFRPLGLFAMSGRSDMSTFTATAYTESSMGVSFKSPQRKSAPALLSSPLDLSVIAGQAERATLAAAAPLWGLALLKFGVELPFLVNDAYLLRILKETPMLLSYAFGLPLPRQTCLLNFRAELPCRRTPLGLSSSALSLLLLQSADDFFQSSKLLSSINSQDEKCLDSLFCMLKAKRFAL